MHQAVILFIVNIIIREWSQNLFFKERTSVEMELIRLWAVSVDFLLR